MHKFHPFIIYIADLVILGASFLVAYEIRAAFGTPIQPLVFYVPFVAASIALFIFSAFIFSLYRKSRILFSLSYLSDFFRTYFLFAFCLLAFSFFTKTDYARAVVLFFIVGSFFTLYFERLMVAWILHIGSGMDEDVRKAAQGVLTMVQVTPDPLAFLEMMRLERSTSPVEVVLKRLFDIVFASVALVLCLPMLPVVVRLIKRDSPGPVFISQTRVGKDGALFTLYKFRTMHQDAALYAPCPRGEDDPRVTRIGKKLRKYSIDELPQLWNIIKGDMSIVGPRPEMPFIVDKYADWQKARLRVTPGLTGLWQILGRKDLPLEENLEYDLYYVFNRSFSLDCAIILKTLPHLTLPKGAY